MPTKDNTESFIAKAKRVHGDRYDYSKVDYQGSETPIIIICKEHGEFQQTPHRHLRGDNCPKCSCRAPLDTERFIKKSKTIHGDKYDYSATRYVNNHTLVKIYCPIHGEFSQLPSLHMSGSGCKECSTERRAGLKRSNTDDFIKKSKTVHGNNYDYSCVNYINAVTPVTIICPIHGKFEQTPHKHLYGHGCPECGAKNNLSEIKTLEILRQNFSLVEYQKVFPFLRNGSGVQKLDFYLPEYNCVIELNGRQHYVPVDGFGGEDEYKKNTERDIRKNELCKENGIKIYYYTPIYMSSYIKDDYIDKVYTSLEELISEIKNSK